MNAFVDESGIFVRHDGHVVVSLRHLRDAFSLPGGYIIAEGVSDLDMNGYLAQDTMLDINVSCDRWLPGGHEGVNACLDACKRELMEELLCHDLMDRPIKEPQHFDNGAPRSIKETRRALRGYQQGGMRGWKRK